MKYICIKDFKRQTTICNGEYYDYSGEYLLYHFIKGVIYKREPDSINYPGKIGIRKTNVSILYMTPLELSEYFTPIREYNLNCILES